MTGERRRRERCTAFVEDVDGFGRSDTREKLRAHFEVDRFFVVLATLKALADEGVLPAAKVGEAIAKYGIDAGKMNPFSA